MEMLNSIQGPDEVSPANANPAEYWELISGQMNILYLLSFLLTADKTRAEQCLDQALDDFVEGFEDFVDWSRTRGRDAVLKYAICMMKPDAEGTQDEMDFSDTAHFPDGNQNFGVIAGLPTFERFVFVVTGLYGRSDTECAKLLATTRWEVSIARELTEQILATSNEDGPARSAQPSAARFEGGYLFNPRYSSC